MFYRETLVSDIWATLVLLQLRFHWTIAATWLRITPLNLVWHIRLSRRQSLTQFSSEFKLQAHDTHSILMFWSAILFYACIYDMVPSSALSRRVGASV